MFAMFDILSVIVPIMFIVVFGIIIFSIIQGISTWHKNNNSPRLTVPAVIVAKRTDVSYHRHANAGDMSGCLLYTSPSPRDVEESRMPSSA